MRGDESTGNMLRGRGALGKGFFSCAQTALRAPWRKRLGPEDLGKRPALVRRCAGCAEAVGLVEKMMRRKLKSSEPRPEGSECSPSFDRSLTVAALKET